MNKPINLYGPNRWPHRLGQWPREGARSRHIHPAGAALRRRRLPRLRTADGIGFDDALPERPSMVRATRADGANLAAAPHERDRLAPRLTRQRLITAARLPRERTGR